MEKPFGTDLATRGGAQRTRCTRSSTRSRSSGSTTSSARRRRRTSWRSASPTACSSRSGTATSSSTCRSTCPRRSGSRAAPAFYESTGAYRDMVVTHLMQVLAFMAMEPPTSLAPGPISDEKLKVFRSMKPIEPHDVVRGQYSGYRGKEEVAEYSDTETFIALKVEIDNWRWAGVPFFLRTGKKLAEGARIISIAFKEPPLSMFPAGLERRHAGPRPPDLRPRRPVPDVAVVLRQAPRARACSWRSCRCSSPPTRPRSSGDVLEAYERLILDAMRGDHTLFTTAAGIETLWEKSIPLLQNPPPVRAYAPGSLGPQRDPPADRPARLAAAVRAVLARPERRRRSRPAPLASGTGPAVMPATVAAGDSAGARRLGDERRAAGASSGCRRTATGRPRRCRRAARRPGRRSRGRGRSRASARDSEER